MSIIMPSPDHALMSGLKLGVMARDRVSKFSGTLTARIEYLGGRVEWQITALVADDLSIKREWFDEWLIDRCEDDQRSVGITG